MENFTDLFGDDLTGLDGLGELGNFGGASAGAPGGPSANAPPVIFYSNQFSEIIPLNRGQVLKSGILFLFEVEKLKFYSLDFLH